MSRYADNVVDQFGRPVAGASVTIHTQDGAVAALTQDGGAALANPFVTNADGGFHFIASDGLYTARFAWGGRVRLVDEQIVVGAGLPLPADVVAVLSGPNGSANVVHRDPATGSATRTVKDVLAQSYSDLDASVTATATAAQNTANLKAGIASIPRTIDGVGLRTVRATKGQRVFAGGNPKLGNTPATGMTFPTADGLKIQGEGPLATLWDTNATGNQHLMHVGPGYVHFELEGISLRNTGLRADTVAVRLDPAGYGGKANFINVSSSGFSTVFSIYDKPGDYGGAEPYQGGDTNYIAFGSYIDVDRLFSTELSNQAVINMLFMNNGIYDKEAYYTNGGSETTLLCHNQPIVDTVIRFGPYAGGVSSLCRIENSKFEYHAAGASIVKLEPSLTDDVNTLYWTNSNLSGGIAQPGNFETHSVIIVDGARLDGVFNGGRLQGAIQYRSVSAQDFKTRLTFTNMLASPSPENLALTGTGNHPLISWKNNADRPDVVRGGQRYIGGIDLVASHMWHGLNEFLVNTGGGIHTGTFGTRRGANFTIQLPARTYLREIAAFFQTATNGDTRIDVWANDSSFTDANIAATLVIPAGTVGYAPVPLPATAMRNLPDGKVYVRITKAGLDLADVGCLFLTYNAYAGV